MRSVSAPSTSQLRMPAGLQTSQARSVSSPSAPSSSAAVPMAALDASVSHHVHRNQVIQPWSPPTTLPPPTSQPTGAIPSRDQWLLGVSSAPIANSPLPSTFLPPPTHSTRRRGNHRSHPFQNTPGASSSATSQPRDRNVKEATKCFNFVVCIQTENVGALFF